MKKALSLFIAAACLCPVLNGCGKKTETSARDTEKSITDITSEMTSGTTSDTTTDTEAQNDRKERRDPDSVIFASYYSNMAWGLDIKDFYIMGDGRTYRLDDYIDLNRNADKLEETPEQLKKLIKYTDPCYILEPQYVQALCDVAEKIDPNASTKRESARFDGGQTSVYFYRKDGTAALCKSSGDTNVTIDDPNISEFERLWKDMRNHVVSGATPVETHLLDEFPFEMNLHCGYISEVKGDYGRFIFPNPYTFKEVAKEWGIDISALTFLDDDNYTNCILFVQVRNVSSSGYLVENEAFLYQEDVFRFLPSDTCKAPGPDEVVLEMMDGFLSICPVKTRFPADQKFYTEDGAEWERINDRKPTEDASEKTSETSET